MRNAIHILLFVFLCSSLTSIILAAGPPDVLKVQREINVLRIEMARPNRSEKQLQMLRSHLARVDFQIQSMMKDAPNDQQLQKLADAVRRLHGDRSPNPIAKAHRTLPAAPPANDSCENAQAIGEGTFSGTTVEATPDGSSSCDFEASPDVWFDYQPSSTGYISISTHNSSYYTLISVHSGCPGSVSNEIACNTEGASGFESRLLVHMTSGAHYKIRVGSNNNSDIDFSLQVAQIGSMSGTITDTQTQAPLDQVDVLLFDQDGNPVAATTTDPAGNYLFSMMAAGSYYAVTRNDLNYIDELYNNILCWSFCDVTTGTPIVISPLSNTVINMDLSRGGSFSGTVRDAGTSTVLPGVQVDTFDQNGYFDTVYTNEGGLFTKGGLPTGDYFAIAGSNDYLEELYDNLPCPCDPLTGSPISVTVGNETTNIDFDLDHGGTITGTVTDSASGNPIVGAHVLVVDNSGEYVTEADTDFLGQYAVGGLRTGNYFLHVYGLGVYLDELYDNIPCPSSCDPTSGTPVPVTATNTTPGINFALSRLGSFSGQVVNALTGAPMPNVLIRAFDSNGNWVRSAYTDALGNYVADTLIDGSYYAIAYGSDFYIPEVYNGILCWLSCDPTSGNVIPVALGTNTTGIHFALDPGGSIAGRITDAGNGTPLDRLEVDVYDSSNQFVGSGLSDYDGHYVVGRLLSGDYYVRTRNAHNEYYLDELYDNIPCFPQCNPSSGTPVSVTLNSLTANIDFSLDKMGSIGGTVTDALTGLPIPDFYVDVFDSNGNYIRSDYGSDSFGHFVIRGLTPGNYFVACQGFGSNFDYMYELYDGIPCANATCDVTAGNPVLVNLSSYTSGIDFSLQRSQQSLFADDFDDGVLDSAWTYDKGTWVESGGILQGTASKGASALATPFTGCSSCTVEAVLQSGGGTGNRVWLLGWYQDKANFAELMMKQEAGKWILKQHAGGTVVSKASISMPISANIPYAVKIAFDGSAFSVYIDNVLAFTMPNRAPSAPQGTVGFQLKKTTASFDSILVYE